VLRRHFGFNVGITTDVREFMGGVLIHACVIDSDGKSLGEGHAHTTTLNKDKCLEKTETTAIGRALAACGLAGGEYATQNELDTYEERYEEKAPLPYEPTEDEKRTINDICHLIKCSQSKDEMDEVFKEYSEELGEFGIEGDKPSNHICQVEINQTNKEMLAVWENGNQAQSLAYSYTNVNHACDAYVGMKATIEAVTALPVLEAYYEKWEHKIATLETALKADKYKRDGLSPYATLVTLYNHKIKELS